MLFVQINNNNKKSAYVAISPSRIRVTVIVCDDDDRHSASRLAQLC